MKRTLAGLIAVLFLIPFTVRAEEGLVTGLSLLRTMGARPAGMGEAFVGVSGDVQGLGFNPAGLASITAPTLTASYNNGIDDDSFGHAAYAHSFSFGSIFLGGSHYDAGKIELNITGSPVEERTAQQDSVGMVGFALGRNLPVAIGMTVKMFKSELIEEVTANTVAVDGGIIFKTPFTGLTLGGALQNVGSDLKYEVEEESLPQTFRGGAAYDLDFSRFTEFKDIPYHLLVAVDGVKTKDQDGAVNSGLEFRRDMVVLEQSGYAALRGGYAGGPERFSAGLGFVMGSFMIDYAIGFSKNSLDEINRVNIGWKFGVTKKETVMRPTRTTPEPESKPKTAPHGSKSKLGDIPQR